MRTYLCIDLKSFYASVECVERHLDPFTTNLVVADPERSKSTICLAITPAMKRLGIRNRCRLHEIPPGITYITAMPRMQLYIDYSAMIYSVYLQFAAPEDIHLYSIDECFIDITDYMKLYGKTARELAADILYTIKRETGITATAGIGTNLYLAKIALDIMAKHSPENMGILDEFSYRRILWEHRPLTDFWRIGSKTAGRLARYGIFTMGDIARTSVFSEDWLFQQFGIDAELLIDHAWGCETCSMRDIKQYRPQSHSLSSGQVLMRNYSFDEAVLIAREMADQLALDLVERHLVTKSLSLHVGYDHLFFLPSVNASVSWEGATSSSRRLMEQVTELFGKKVQRHAGIRRICITYSQLREEDYVQMNLFEDTKEAERERQMQQTILSIRKRYGKNSLLRGVNLLPASTLRERNHQIGGHRA